MEALQEAFSVESLLSVAVDRGVRENQVKNAIAQHNDDIETLKTELKQKDEEISSLLKVVKNLESKNDELEVIVESRNEEIKSLKSRIIRLEQEKKAVEDELAGVQLKLGRVEREVKDLGEARHEQDDKNRKLEETMGKISKKMDGMKTDLENAMDENHTLKKEVKELRETQQRRSRPIAAMGAGHPGCIFPALPQVRNEASPMLHLGELCWQIQGKMYKAVLPAHYTPIRSYKIKTIERDIQKLVKTTQEKEKAQQKWNELREKLHWQEKYVDVMKSLQDSRNNEAHPALNEELLLRFATGMESQGVLKGWLSLQSIKDLIMMWKYLSSLDK